MELTRNFSLQELIKSDTAIRYRHLCDLFSHLDICRHIRRHDGWLASWRNHLCLFVHRKACDPSRKASGC